LWLIFFRINICKNCSFICLIFSYFFLPSINFYQLLETYSEKQGTEKNLKEFAFLLSNPTFLSFTISFVFLHGVIDSSSPEGVFLDGVTDDVANPRTTPTRNFHCIERIKESFGKKGTRVQHSETERESFKYERAHGITHSHLFELDYSWNKKFVSNSFRIFQTHPSLSLSNTFFSL